MRKNDEPLLRNSFMDIVTIGVTQGSEPTFFPVALDDVTDVFEDVTALFWLLDASVTSVKGLASVLLEMTV